MTDIYSEIFRAALIVTEEPGNLFPFIIMTGWLRHILYIVVLFNITGLRHMVYSALKSEIVLAARKA